VSNFFDFCPWSIAFPLLGGSGGCFESVMGGDSGSFFTGDGNFSVLRNLHTE
jgi:hypothetical protein